MTKVAAGYTWQTFILYPFILQRYNSKLLFNRIYLMASDTHLFAIQSVQVFFILSLTLVVVHNLYVHYLVGYALTSSWF